MEGINRRSNHGIDNRVNYIRALLGIELNYRLSISRLFLVKRIMGPLLWRSCWKGTVFSVEKTRWSETGVARQ